ncbi:hypothetical protein MTO96_028192 [Rhipicephalus appendiculatus]
MLKTPLDILHPDLRSTALLKQLKQKLAAAQRVPSWAIAGACSATIRQELPFWPTLVCWTSGLTCKLLLSARTYTGWNHMASAC